MATPINPKVELDVGGWTDVTDYVYYRDGITITRGKSDENARLDPSTCRFTVNNRDGRFSPRNPVGPYYGILGRNTPCRVSVPFGESYMRITGGSTDRATTGDAAALDITGDIDIRVDMTLDSWYQEKGLCSKWATVGDQRSWYFATTSDGSLLFEFTSDGTTGTEEGWFSLASVPVTRGRLAVRVTMDVDNGSGGYDITFYTADTISGPWTQLGDVTGGVGVASIYSSTANPQVGHANTVYAEAHSGKVHAFELRSGIGGTAVANPNFAIQTAGASSFADTASPANTWTIHDNAEITDRVYRFWGEVSTWPQRWDISGTDVYTTVEASGITRRLTQGASALDSVMYRAMTLQPDATVQAYWPMEDEEGSTFASSGLPGNVEMTISGSGQFAQNSDFVASRPLPTMGTGIWSGNVPSYTSTNKIQVRFLMLIPAGGATNGQILCRFKTTGTAKSWELYYGTGGTLGLRGFDADGTNITDTGAVGFSVDGKKLRVSVEIQPDGSDVDYGIVTLEEGETVGSTYSGTLSSATGGRVYWVILAKLGGLTDTVMGHLSVQSDITSIFDLSDQFNAYNTENPYDRIVRLCDEESVPLSSFGEIGDNSITMGYQEADTFLNLMFDVEATDMGRLYEPKDTFGIGYRTRTSLYTQSAAVTLDYASNELAASLAPVDDDQDVHNDVTVVRKKGSSSRQSLSSGSMSTQEPPNGIGRYDVSYTISLGSDSQLASQAGWRLLLGTLDEARYPSIELNLRHSTWDDTVRKQAVLGLDIGDRVVVENPPSWLPPDNIDVLVEGYTETFTGMEHTMSLNCSPGSPYYVGTVSDSVYGRCDTTSSVLNEPLTTTETDVDVATITGPIWTTSAPEFPFDIKVGGEVMTVTSISGSSSPQTFTVTRSVNGVVKTHSSGTQVRIAHPMIVVM